MLSATFSGVTPGFAGTNAPMESASLFNSNKGRVVIRVTRNPLLRQVLKREEMYVLLNAFTAFMRAVFFLAERFASYKIIIR